VGLHPDGRGVRGRTPVCVLLKKKGEKAASHSGGGEGGMRFLIRQVGGGGEGIDDAQKGSGSPASRLLPGTF